MKLKIVEKMMLKGGYIPYTDHMVPPETSFSDYKYYRDGLKDIIGGV